MITVAASSHLIVIWALGLSDKINVFNYKSLEKNLDSKDFIFAHYAYKSKIY